MWIPYIYLTLYTLCWYEWFWFMSSKVVGQLAGDPSKGRLHACAGGVTGASPHIVIRNNGNNNTNLFIRLV